MNKENKPEGTPQNSTHTETSEMAQLMQMVKEYVVPIGAGVLIALVLVIGFGLYKSSKASRVARASAALMQAGTLEEIQQVAREYKNTPTGPAALLGLANTYLQSGQSVMARNTYDQFIRDYPDHILRPSAELGKAYCLEAEGDLNGALAAFEAFAKTHPDYFLVTQAIFSQGRCLEQLGRFDDSKIVYENFIVDYPDSRWIPHAKTALLYVDKAKRAKEKGLDSRPPPTLFGGMQMPAFGTMPALEAEVVEVDVQDVPDAQPETIPADAPASVVLESTVDTPAPEVVPVVPDSAPQQDDAPSAPSEEALKRRSTPAPGR